MSGLALLFTVGVYGLVAGIVKLDDLGLWLALRPGSLQQALGRGSLAAAPWLMKTLSVAGTAAMCLVGRGILVHGVPVVYQGIEGYTLGLGNLAHALLPALANGAVGALAGALIVGVLALAERLRRGAQAAWSAGPGPGPAGLAGPTYFSMPSSSTSNCSTAFGGIGPPGVPRAP